MNALMDTYTFLWWNMDDPHLSPEARKIIGDGRNQIFLSAASVWEIVIKTAKGRLILPKQPESWIPKMMEANRFNGLAVNISHTLEVSKLPDVHSDPVDRLLAAQCRVEKLPLLSMDERMGEYGIEMLW